MKKEISIQVCRLCLEEKKLCKSHIIPEFLYAVLYDESHRFYEITELNKGKAKRTQKGYWEHLLCSECESKISRFERHIRRLFVDELPPFIPDSKRIRRHPRIEYKLAKLFFLSVLWRASVSSLSMFKLVSLGPHEERIRKMLNEENPGDFLDYPVTVHCLYFKGEHFRDFMVDPTYMKVEGRRCYRLVLMGFVVLIYVDSVPLKGLLTKFVMHPDKLFETYVTDLREFKFLATAWDTAVRTRTNLDP